MNNKVCIPFISLGLLSLIAGTFFGCIAAFQFVLPDAFLKWLPFYVTRPLHVSLVVSWIFATAIGGIYFYLPKGNFNIPYYHKLPKIHFYLYVFIGVIIIFCYLTKQFGGREYFEFPVYLSVPIFFSWILFSIYFFSTAFYQKNKWPIYKWMWATGIIFFLITYSESCLWVFPFFRENIIRDLTVQWKAYGALIGSWNMLVYGTAFYLMGKIKNNNTIYYSKESFFFYFLAFTNLLFGWGHHTYMVPAAKWILHVSYIISMSEWLVLGKIIWDWKKSLSDAQKYNYSVPYRFLMAADIWIFLNLLLAILISVPSIHVYTHGTHITVAHAMGSTIGINTMILLGSVFYIFSENKIIINNRYFDFGYALINFSLLVFWISLIISGFVKGLAMNNEATFNFSQTMDDIHQYLYLFALSGLGIFLGLLMVTIPLLNSLIQRTILNMLHKS